MYFDIRKLETTNKTFRLPSELLHKLEKVAQQKGVSLNYLVGQRLAMCTVLTASSLW